MEYLFNKKKRAISTFLKYILLEITILPFDLINQRTDLIVVK